MERWPIDTTPLVQIMAHLLFNLIVHMLEILNVGRLQLKRAYPGGR